MTSRCPTLPLCHMMVSAPDLDVILFSAFAHYSTVSAPMFAPSPSLNFILRIHSDDATGLRTMSVSIHSYPIFSTSIKKLLTTLANLPLRGSHQMGSHNLSLDPHPKRVGQHLERRKPQWHNDSTTRIHTQRNKLLRLHRIRMARLSLQ